jgi:predicted unusual protein kinase regulating ubiquinone biosynthesis (AarF/ABC1/UbiB family)
MLLFNNIILLLQSVYIVGVEYTKYKLNINNNIQAFKNVTNRLSNLNILYTKILQWVVNDSVFENKEMKKILENFTDNVKYEESDIDYTTLLDLVNNNNIKLESLKPIKSGTLSLVYKGILNDETSVIIKILKNNIKYKLEESIKYFIFLSKISKYIPYINECNLDKIVVDINSNLILQINFDQEVKNTNKFYEYFKDNKNIVIPKVYDEYTLQYGNLIVMNYINGSNIYSADENIEKLEYLKILYEFMFECMFNYKIFHGDLHPGNILFIKEDDKYKLGIIDYGIIEECDDTLKQKLCLFFKKLIKGNDKDTYEYIVNTLGEPNIKNNKTTIIDKEKILDELMICKNKYKILTDSVKANDIYYINMVLNKNNMMLDLNFSKVFLIVSSMYSLLYMLQESKNGNVFKECFEKYCSNYIFTYLNFIE